ncbi:unnamed protein product [Chrysoparadoxa australica]
MLKWYSCGPTVYDEAHVGHARTYVTFDIIRRVLVHMFGYDLHCAMGVTDVDDKIINRAGERGIPPQELARHYEQSFLKDMARLNVMPMDSLLRVTEHMPNIIAYIQRIMDNGGAYEAEGGVFFDVEALGATYGEALGCSMKEVAGDTPMLGKKSHTDFALWKASKPGEPSWPSPFGEGRPGWHIECSAMTHAVFGEKLDLHSGGIDLKFPHHTNEIAQSECHNCSRGWCRYWLHTGHLHIDGFKMSKSLKNFVTVREFLEKWGSGEAESSTSVSLPGDDFRTFCLAHRYSSHVTLTDGRIQEARRARLRLEHCFGHAVRVCRDVEELGNSSYHFMGIDELSLMQSLQETRSSCRKALASDFDTPAALASLLELAGVVRAYCDRKGSAVVPGPVGACVRFALSMMDAVGLSDTSKVIQSGGHLRAQGAEGADLGEVTSGLTSVMVDFRSQIRQKALDAEASNLKGEVLKLCDSLRQDLLPGLGVMIEDQPGGHSSWYLGKPGQLSDHAKEAASAASRRASQEVQERVAIPPHELFKAGKYAGMYTAYDELGVPTHGSGGKELSKSARKKALKVHKKHQKAHEKWSQTQEAPDE